MEETISIEQYAAQIPSLRDEPADISPMAIVDPAARIGRGVKIGPFCVVGPDVTIGDGCVLDNNVTLEGKVTLGVCNRMFPGVVIGGEPQDIGYRDEPTEVVVGSHNVFRECVTVNRATVKEDRVTVIGSKGYFMACVHVAHDCVLGDHVVIANGSVLGGHVHVGSHVTISGNVGVTHYASIGSFAFVGAISRVLQDVPPYMLADGNPARPRCVNIVALKRNKFDSQAIRSLTEAYRLVFRSRVGLDNAREILRAKDQLSPELQALLDFIEYQQNGRHGRGGEQRRKAA